MKQCFLLYFVGLLLVCIEIFIPGGIVGAFGAISLVMSFWLAFTQISSVFGTYFVTGGLILLLIAIYLSVKKFPASPAGKKMLLAKDERAFKATEADLELLKDKTGIAHTTLRPSGTGLIDGKKFSVVTEGNFLEKGTPFSIIKVEGNKIVVKQKEER